MKKLFTTTLLLFVLTMVFAQSTESAFKKNEISLAPYAANFIYDNLNIGNGWSEGDFSFNFFESNYRRFLNQNTALRFGGSVFRPTDPLDCFSVLTLNVRIGFEKYLTLSPKFQLYGGAQINLKSYNPFSDLRHYAAGGDLIGGVRYNFNNRWAISSEIILPTRYNWFKRNDYTSWETGIRWQPVKLNFSF